MTLIQYRTYFQKRMRDTLGRTNTSALLLSGLASELLTGPSLARVTKPQSPGCLLIIHHRNVFPARVPPILAGSQPLRPSHCLFLSFTWRVNSWLCKQGASAFSLSSWEPAALLSVSRVCRPPSCGIGVC